MRFTLILVSLLLLLNSALALNKNSVKYSLNFNFDSNNYNLTDSFQNDNLIKTLYNTHKATCLSCCNKDPACFAASISSNECSLYKSVPVFFKDVIISTQSHIYVKGKLVLLN